MKTEKQQTEKSTIEQLREIRDNINAETQDMTFEQFKKYVEEQLTETLHPTATWQKQDGVAV
jgi:lipoate-protein ligase A